MSDYGAVRTQLREDLDRLLRRVGAIQRDLRQEHDRDWQERATELENDEVLRGLDEKSRADIGEIREALRRIDGGTYGMCSACGRTIDASRLSAVPSVSTCVTCAD